MKQLDPITLEERLYHVSQMRYHLFGAVIGVPLGGLVRALLTLLDVLERTLKRREGTPS